MKREQRRRVRPQSLKKTTSLRKNASAGLKSAALRYKVLRYVVTLQFLIKISFSLE